MVLKDEILKSYLTLYRSRRAKKKKKKKQVLRKPSVGKDVKQLDL